MFLASGVQSSALGFGCAPILGPIGSQQARNAIACALDAGVNHFDVARCYGYGDAEKFVGRVLQERRSSVVIASKFGLEATTLARFLRPAKPVVRWLRETRGQSLPQTRRASGKRNHSLLRKRPITGRTMLESLNKSLRALGTDYLDILFLHEPEWDRLPVEEVADAAAKLKRQGKILAFGAAFYRDGRRFSELPQGVFDVLQFDAPRLDSDDESALDDRRDQANVLFSPFRTGKATSDNTKVLSRLFRDFPNSVVLCSMFNPAHIRSNAASAM